MFKWFKIKESELNLYNTICLIQYTKEILAGIPLVFRYYYFKYFSKSKMNLAKFNKNVKKGKIAVLLFLVL